MSINKTAYNTLACNGYVLEKIYESIKAAFFSGQLPPVEGYSNIRIIEGGSSVANDIKIILICLLMFGILVNGITIKTYLEFEMKLNTIWQYIVQN